MTKNTRTGKKVVKPGQPSAGPVPTPGPLSPPPASPPPAPPTPPPPPAAPTPEEIYLYRAKSEIEYNHYAFGGLLTIRGSWLSADGGILKANGNPWLKLGPREFTLLSVLAWHAFKFGRIIAPSIIDEGAFLPVEDFLAVVHLRSLIDSLRARHPTIRVWGDFATTEVFHDVVNRLRAKILATHTHPRLIETGPMGGYRLSLPPLHIQLVLDGVVYGRRDVDF